MSFKIEKLTKLNPNDFFSTRKHDPPIEMDEL